jgi:hypothetical protein
MARYYGGRQCGASGPRAEIKTDTPQRQVSLASAGAGALITTESIAPRTAWSVADTQAGIESVHIAQANGDVIVASLIARDQTQPAETPAETETVANLISRLMPTLSDAVPAQLSSVWPEAAYILSEGIVSSVTPNATELAARRDSALSDG